MAKRLGSVDLKKRIPRLCFTTTRGVGRHVNYRNPDTGVAKKHRFAAETEAKVASTRWLARRLAGGDDEGAAARPRVVRTSGGECRAPGRVIATGALPHRRARLRPGCATIADQFPTGRRPG